MKVLTHELSVSISADFVDFCQKHEVIFHSENCFSVKNNEGLYLTAFPNKEVKFYAEKCRDWEKFYILDDESEQLIDFVKNEMKSTYKLFSEKNKLHIVVNDHAVTPSFIPPASFTKSKWYAEYRTLSENKKIFIHKPLIYFCIYGGDKYYECFFLSIRSLIEKGNYTGDILIKADNIEKVRDFCKEFNNKFIFSEIDRKLGIFNRYWLHEPCLEEYSSLIYFDSDILTIRDISATLKSFQQGDLCSFIDGDPSFEKIQDYFDGTGSFPTHKWYGMQYLDKNYVRQSKEFYVLNSGLFVINDLAKVKPIMDKVIRYRFMEDEHGDQPFFNIALYNSDIDIKTLNHVGHLGFSHSNYDSFKKLDKVLIHYNIGVGYMSKLDLMKETWAYINRM